MDVSLQCNMTIEDVVSNGLMMNEFSTPTNALNIAW